VGAEVLDNSAASRMEHGSPDQMVDALYWVGTVVGALAGSRCFAHPCSDSAWVFLDSSLATHAMTENRVVEEHPSLHRFWPAQMSGAVRASVEIAANGVLGASPASNANLGVAPGVIPG
jgi:hypothetical protein